MAAVEIKNQVTGFYLEHASAPWHGVLWAAAAIGLAWWAWRRYGPAPSGFSGTIARICRTLAVILVVAMAAGPSWRTTETTMLPGTVTVLYDRSASMLRGDTTGNRPRAAVAADLHQALEEAAKTRQLLLDHQSIGGARGALRPEDIVAGALTSPGASSPLADDVMRVTAVDRPDLLVLVTDGRVTDGGDWESLAQYLRGREQRLAVLGLGSERVDPGLWIDDVVFNKEAALNEKEPIEVRGSVRALTPGPAKVRVYNDGELVQERTFDVPAAPAGDADATARPVPFAEKVEAQLVKEGTAKLRVEIEQTGFKDQREFTVHVSERKLQVLVLDLHPRYELRYLGAALRRDHTITAHCYLSEGKWRRWGSEGPDHLPLSPNELRDYDVVMIGDIGPDSLTEQQMSNIEKAVRQEGTGLVWLPGETGASSSFRRTSLGALMPVDMPDGTAVARGYLTEEAHHLARTETAIKLALLDSGGVDWARLPDLIGACPITASMVRPGAVVLMEDQDHDPIVVARDFGAGRAMFIGVDDTWRWRQKVGDRYLHRFHSQLLRHVAENRHFGNHNWRIVASPRRAVPGELVTVSLTPNGPLHDTKPDRVTVRLGRSGVDPVVATLVPGGGDDFVARVPAPAVGNWLIDVADGISEREVEEGELEVLQPVSEIRDPRADLNGLKQLALATGGQFFGDVPSLIKDLPDVRKSRVETLPPSGMWDTSWWFALVVALFVLEWALRRRSRLP